VNATIEGRTRSDTPLVLTFRRPEWSLLVVLAVIVAVGALIGHALNAAGIAMFLLFISSIDPKPAWRFFWDPPRPEIGRWSWGSAGRRLIPLSPRDQLRLPRSRR
jgi:hypothetical protein